MSRKEFSFLLKQYLAGKCTEEEKKFVEHWFGIIRNEDRENLNFSDLEELEPLMWEKIKSRTGATTAPQRRKTQVFIWRWAAVAAASVLIVIAGLTVFKHEKKEWVSQDTDIRDNTDSWVTKHNQSDQPEEIRLSDGSTAVLNPGSSLSFPEEFNGTERKVVLTGDAFFKVSRMPEKPFFVYTGNLVTKVLGTSFHIKANAEKGVSVEVVTGRVAVFERASATDQERLKKTEEIILSPNQKVVYFEDRHELITSLVDNPKMLSKPEKDNVAPSFVFDEVPMTTVLHQLEQAYGISIELENNLMSNCPLTADLSDLALFDQLEMICAATKSRYAVLGTSILISGEGCSNLE